MSILTNYEMSLVDSFVSRVYKLPEEFDNLKGDVFDEIQSQPKLDGDLLRDEAKSFVKVCKDGPFLLDLDDELEALCEKVDSSSLFAEGQPASIKYFSGVFSTFGFEIKSSGGEVDLPALVAADTDGDTKVTLRELANHLYNLSFAGYMTMHLSCSEGCIEREHNIPIFYMSLWGPLSYDYPSPFTDETLRISSPYAGAGMPTPKNSYLFSIQYLQTPRFLTTIRLFGDFTYESVTSSALEMIRDTIYGPKPKEGVNHSEGAPT